MDGNNSFGYRRPKFNLSEKDLKLHWGTEFVRIEAEVADNIGDGNDPCHVPINKLLGILSSYKFKLAPEQYCIILQCIGHVLEYVSDLEESISVLEEQLETEPTTPETPGPARKKVKFDVFDVKEESQKERDVIEIDK